jgi:DNA adenine methylase
MRTPITYYGGKQNMLKHILPLFPKDIKQYVEPFLGGGAVFFAKLKSPHEVINDLDGRITNFYKICQSDKFFELQEKINSTANSEIPYKYTKDIMEKKVEPKDEVEYAWAFWVQTCMTFASQIGGGFGFANNDTQVKKAMNKRDAFTEKYMDRLKRVEIFQRDAVDLIKLKDGKDTFIYADPPYVSSAQSHYSGYTEDHFIQLLEALANIKGRFLLSSYPEHILLEYTEKYKWNRKEVYQKTSVANVRQSEHNNNTIRKAKIEVLTWNYNARGIKPIIRV